MKLYLLLGVLVVSSYVFQPSEQCMCMPVHPQEAFCKADFVIQASITSQQKFRLMDNYKILADMGLDATTPYYDIKIVRVFKGLTKVMQSTVQSGKNNINTVIEIIGKGTSCDTELKTGKMYLLSGKIFNGAMQLQFCDWFERWHSLTKQMKGGLYGDYNCDCRIATCIDGYCDRNTECQFNVTWDKPVDENFFKNKACRKNKNRKCLWVEYNIP